MVGTMPKIMVIKYLSFLPLVKGEIMSARSAPYSVIVEFGLTVGQS